MRKKINLGIIGIDHGHIFDMLDEIANKLDSITSDEVTLLDAHKSLGFFTTVYHSARKKKNISFRINKNNTFYNSWLP